MKKLMVIIVLVYFIMIAATVQAQQNLQYYGDKTVTFDPSPDERVTGYIIFIHDGETEWNTGSFTGTEVVLDEGRLHPGKIYTLTAIAHDALGNQSARSEALVVTVGIAPLPEQNLPPLYIPTSAPGALSITGGI